MAAWYLLASTGVNVVIRCGSNSSVDKGVKGRAEVVYCRRIITWEIWAVYYRGRRGRWGRARQGFRPEEAYPYWIMVGLFKDVGVISGSDPCDL